MGVAFRKEEDSESAAADLPDRPVSAHPNLVTARGLAQLETALVEARAAGLNVTAEIQGMAQEEPLEADIGVAGRPYRPRR